MLSTSASCLAEPQRAGKRVTTGRRCDRQCQLPDLVTTMRCDGGFWAASSTLGYNQVAAQSPEAAGPWHSNSSASSLFTPGIFPPPHSSGLLGYPQHQGRTDRLICHLSNHAHRVLPQGLRPDQLSAFSCILLISHMSSAGVPSHRRGN